MELEVALELKKPAEDMELKNAKVHLFVCVRLSIRVNQCILLQNGSVACMTEQTVVVFAAVYPQISSFDFNYYIASPSSP